MTTDTQIMHLITSQMEEDVIRWRITRGKGMPSEKNWKRHNPFQTTLNQSLTDAFLKNRTDVIPEMLDVVEHKRILQTANLSPLLMY